MNDITIRGMVMPDAPPVVERALESVLGHLSVEAWGDLTVVVQYIDNLQDGLRQCSISADNVSKLIDELNSLSHNLAYIHNQMKDHVGDV